MGRKGPYIPGSFYRTDDISGIPVRAERTRREWRGLVVAEGVARLWVLIPCVGYQS